MSVNVSGKEVMKNELAYNQILEFFNNYEEWKNDTLDSKTLKEKDLTRIVNLVIDKLNSFDGQVRYIASHLILTFNLDSAKDKLIQRIFDKDTLNENGTMTYALGHLNCNKNLVEVFKILATQSYESKCHAYNILSEQEFVFTKDQIDKMRQIFESVIQNKKANQIFDEETFEMVKDGYEGFKHYINE